MRKASPRTPPSATFRTGSSRALIVIALIATSVAIFIPASSFDFVNFDDPDYVTANPHVRDGLTASGAVWAFTSTEFANWFPITWLSHMLDCELFALRSGMHHVTNVVFHALAAVLLFAFLDRTTHARAPSAFVAFVFALHPLHVESVAWIAERKDVLNAVCWFAALYAYALYAERPSAKRYSLVAAAFCLGLMTKPMIVTLPFVLLLIDYWPLRRNALLLREKVPLFALSAAAAVTTFYIQRASGAVRHAASFPLELRIENALLSYAMYIATTFWPARLTVFYPFPAEVPAWEWISAAIALLAVSMAAWRLRGAYPFFMVGWFWFLGVLVPVIGLVQVGSQARADRYMYVPLVGVTIVIAWGAQAIWTRRPSVRPVLIAGAAAVLIACIIETSIQLQTWVNSETLFRHAIAVTNRNYLALHNLGSALLDEPGRLPEAVALLNESLRIKPDSASVHTDLGTAFSKMGRFPEAITEYEAALTIAPESEIARKNLRAVRANAAIAENNTGAELSHDPSRLDASVAHYKTALQFDPDSAETHYNLAVVLAKMDGRSQDAIRQFEEALRLRPDYAEAQNDLGVVLARTNPKEAVPHFEAAVRIKPDYAEAHYNLAVALSQLPGRMPDAISHFEAAERIQPDPQIERILTRLRKR